jgi:hypothetical protein
MVARVCSRMLFVCQMASFWVDIFSRFVFKLYVMCAVFNILNTKHNCFIQGISPYHAVSTSHHGYKTNQLMTYKVKATACSEIHTKHSTQSEHQVEILNVKPGGT